MKTFFYQRPFLFLQTLSILIQNICNQQTIYYLFSNDHINNIAALKFDFEDDEVLGYYVNLLKTISFRLNETTVQFFFRAGGHSSGDGGRALNSPGAPMNSLPASFPLYTEAVKFVAHRDGMVRAAVKTLTLNVFAIQLSSLRDFLSSPPADIFYERLATYTAERCTALDRLLSSWDATAPRMAATAETYLAEIEDILTFCNDVFAVDVPAITSLLLGHLWKHVVGPILFWPLLGDINNSALRDGGGDPFTEGEIKKIDGTAKVAAQMATDIEKEKKEGAAGISQIHQKSLVGPLCSLYAFERALYAVTDPHLSSLLVSSLFGGPTEDDAAALATALLQFKNNEGATTSTSTAADNACVDSPLSALQQQSYTLTASDLIVGLGASSKTYRTAVLSMLRGGDAQLAAAVVRLVAAVLSRKTLSEETIEAVGLLPRRRRKQKKLLEELTRGASSFEKNQQPQLKIVSDDRQINGTSGNSIPVAATEECAGTTTAAQGLLSSPHDQASSPSSSPVNASSRGPSLRRYSPTDESVLHLPPETTNTTPQKNNNATITAKKLETLTGAPTASTLRGEDNFSEIVDSLLIALNLDLLPPLSLPVIGWALHRLLSEDTGPAELSSEQNILLESAWKKRKEAIAAAAVHAGSWGDAIVPMVVQIWSRIRETVLRTGPGPVHVAGHTWVQTVLLQELHWQLGGGGGGGGGGGSRSTDSLIQTAANTAAEEVTASNFAIAAKVATIRVAACVAAVQIHAVLLTGQVPLHIFKHPLSSSSSGGRESPRFQSNTIFADIVGREITEGSVVPLPLSETEGMQCKVAFSKGVERVVMMCVLGLPSPPPPSSLSLSSSQGTTNTDIDTTAAKTIATEKQDSIFISSSSPLSLASLSAAAVLFSPVVAILDPGTGSTINYGTVLSVAPLLAAAPAVDPDHPQWLHVHVRPQRSALLRLSSPTEGQSGAELAAMDAQLTEGHWVLAFPDEEAAKKAAERVTQSAKVLREMHQKALDPLLEL